MARLARAITPYVPVQGDLLGEACQQEKVGRPIGSALFVAGFENLTGRRLRSMKR